VAVTYPRGYRAGTAACGIKAFTAGASAIPRGQKDDLCVIHSVNPVDAGGVFTTNKVKSASVVIDQLHLRRNRVQALTINSGNANACTGAQGFRDALLMAKLSADRLDLDPDQVLVNSTGVIGRYLPMDAIKSGIAEACGHLTTDAGEAAARAIMTTDTVPKTARMEIDLGDATVRLGGMCKGSGMIHPNMATLLAYITTDAAVEAGLMSKLVRSVADRSFNQVTIDGDSSTNDTFLILANGAAGNEPILEGTRRAEQLEAALVQVARELSRSIARDGEGATKLITVRVLDEMDDRVTHFAQIVRRNVCGHSHGNAGCAVDKQLRETGGQYGWLFLTAIIVVHPINRVFVDIFEQRTGNARQTRLGIPHGRWRIAIYRSKVPLAIH